MKRFALLLTIIISLCGMVILTQANQGDSSAGHIMNAETLSGGNYSLISFSPIKIQEDRWQVITSASGGGYHLLSLKSASTGGNGCCCTYLPCVLRAFP